MPIPEALNTAPFHEAWKRWQAHRKQLHMTLTAAEAKRQLAKLARWGPKKGVQAINESISAGAIYPVLHETVQAGKDGDQ